MSAAATQDGHKKSGCNDEALWIHDRTRREYFYTVLWYNANDVCISKQSDISTLSYQSSS